jgi:TolB-like protein
MDRFSDALTDTVVEQLTSQSDGRYQVIGNALILRGPREQRDLNAIATSLHAAYVVLGQVQSNGDQIRILAHLIRLPDQTHVWVVRTDGTLGDPLGVESGVARTIAAEFSPRLPESSELPYSRLQVIDCRTDLALHFSKRFTSRSHLCSSNARSILAFSLEILRSSS